VAKLQDCRTVGAAAGTDRCADGTAVASLIELINRTTAIVAGCGTHRQVVEAGLTDFTVSRETV